MADLPSLSLFFFAPRYVTEALDSRSTRELLRDSYMFMQQIEENIKLGEVRFAMQYIINLYVYKTYEGISIHVRHITRLFN
jgi:hypothetical protein